MNKLLLTILSLFISIVGKAQIMESGDVFTKVTGIINSMPGETGDDYTEPTEMNEEGWLDALALLFTGFYSDADAIFDTLGYDLIEFSDNPTGETYYILEEDGMSDIYWGTYILNPNACRSELVLMAPHPKKDFNTGKEAIYCFQELDAYFFMMSGTNRCNHMDHSDCDGSTTICTGASEDYRISDLAHVTTSIWQRTTEYVHDNVAGTYFVQFHGFTKEQSDPYVIMSNGTRDDTPNPDKILALRDELVIVDPVLDFKIGHIDLMWDRLLGFTNTNGRYINNSLGVCEENAVNANGRWLHIEQEKFRLRNDITGWNKMGVALGEAFNDGGCPSLALLPVELIYFTAKEVGNKVKLEWETASEINHDFFAIEKSTDGVGFHQIGIVATGEEIESRKRYEYWDMPVSGKNYYRLKQVDLDGSITFSDIRIVEVMEENGNYSVYFNQDNIIIDLISNEESELILYNQIGQIVAKIPIFDSSVQMSLPNMPPGIYFYKIKNRTGQDTIGKVWHP